jgi:hypothetical protein
MASRNLGFEVARNLAESVNDRNALNNLGGGNIASDIELFVNNLNNVTELTWEYSTDQSTISNDKFIFPITVKLVYTDGDIVTVSGSSLGDLNSELTYYVVEFDLRSGERLNQVSFGLSTSRNGSLVSLGNITSDILFTRSDVVTKENLLNIAAPIGLGIDSNFIEDGIYYDYANFNDAFDSIESNVDSFNYLRSFKYAANESTIVNSPIIIKGSTEVYDPAEYNTSETNLATAKSPGVYISNPFSDILNIEKTRAYSTSANPWEIGTEELVTQSTQVNIGDLYFSNGIKFDSITDLNSESGTVSGFTHKIPAVINGVEYFVLLKS